MVPMEPLSEGGRSFLGPLEVKDGGRHARALVFEAKSKMAAAISQEQLALGRFLWFLHTLVNKMA